MASVFTVISGNGGMGKSFFSCNLAYGLGSYGKKVLLVEGSFGNRADDVILAIEPDTQFTVYDICLDVCGVSDAITSPGGMLPDFISASHLACSVNPADGFEKIVSYAKDRYDFVIFDTQSFHPAADAAIGVSHRVFVLTDTSFLSVRNASLCVRRVRDAGLGEVYTILNSISPDNEAVSAFAEDVVDEMGAVLLGIIPYDEFVRQSLLDGDMIFKYNTYAGRALENICKRVLGQSVPDFETGAKNSFFAKNRLVLK